MKFGYKIVVVRVRIFGGCGLWRVGLSFLIVSVKRGIVKCLLFVRLM